MYKIYGWKLSGSLATEAALKEAGADYEIIPVNIRAGEQHEAEYGRINPRRQVPALALPDGSVMTEGAAILLHIADAHPQSRLAPPPGSSERAQHDRWLFFFAVNVYEGELRKLNPQKYVTSADCAEAVKTVADSYVEMHYRIFEEALGDGPYTFGDTFTVLDIYVWMLAQWMPPDWLAEVCPKINRLVESAKVRPNIAPVQKWHFG
jgi:glutathione S-transferase